VFQKNAQTNVVVLSNFCDMLCVNLACLESRNKNDYISLELQPKPCSNTKAFCCLVGLAYQPPASNIFLSEQTSHHQPASSTFLSEQTSTSHQPNEHVVCVGKLGSSLNSKDLKLNGLLGGICLYSCPAPRGSGHVVLLAPSISRIGMRGLCDADCEGVAAFRDT
jgi:hypothetical protein